MASAKGVERSTTINNNNDHQNTFVRLKHIALVWQYLTHPPVTEKVNKKMKFSGVATTTSKSRDDRRPRPNASKTPSIEQSSPLLPSSFSCLKITRYPDCDGPQQHIAIVSLNRPHKKNAMSSIMWKEIGQCFRTIHLTGDVRAVVLHGEGPCFSTGLDLSDPSLLSLSSSSNNTQTSSSIPDPARIGLSFLSKIHEMQACFTAVEECPVPVIAAVHSYCVGAGVDLITACDIRLCTTDSQFSVKEVVVGLAADVGTLQRFPKIVGHGSRVREICLTGEVFDANEAHRIGLVSRVVPTAAGGGGDGSSSSSSEDVLGHALKIAKTIASHSPVAATGTKKSLLYSRDHSVQDGLEHIAAHNALALQTQDLPAAFMASRKKQLAQYADLYPSSRL
jgi:Delta3,5-Delta2,4-dienoyl-CoA isomerase